VSLFGFCGAVARGCGFDFFQAVAGAGVEVEFIEFLQLADALEGCGAERGFAVEGVENDAFEDVSEGHVVIFSEGFEDFEDALFNADAGLYAFDLEGINEHWYQCTMVQWQPQELQGLKPSSFVATGGTAEAVPSRNR
jgi:hypothetical protein